MDERQSLVIPSSQAGAVLAGYHRSEQLLGRGFVASG
jgi:hypothetical protein